MSRSAVTRTLFCRCDRGARRLGRRWCLYRGDARSRPVVMLDGDYRWHEARVAGHANYDLPVRWRVERGEGGTAVTAAADAYGATPGPARR